MKPFASLLLSTLILTACSNSEQQAGTHETDELTKSAAESSCASDGVIVSNAWARPVRAGQPSGAAYMSLCNGTDKDIILTGAYFEGANATELHITAMNANNVATMAHTPEVTIAAGSTAIFKPGAAHIMFIGPQSVLEAGDEALISLSFKTAPKLDIILEVRTEGESGNSHH